MEIEDTRKLNLFNLKILSRYFNAPTDELIEYYNSVLDDRRFIEEINAKICEVKEETGFSKGIFSMTTIPSIDWFAFERILIYVLIRLLRPHFVLETGVYYGGNSAFALLALEHNGVGRMVSVDYPESDIRADGNGESRHPLVGDTELYQSTLRPGFMVPPYLHERWTLIEGDSLKVIPTLKETFDFYIHDSDHSMPFLSKELDAAWGRLSERAFLLVDDIDWSNAFYAFCVKHRLYPLLMTDNGKDDLRVRVGIASRCHKYNSDDLFT